MSYMGAYNIWLEQEGLTGLGHVEKYHKENPNMIPKSRIEETCPVCKQHYNEEEDGYFYRNVNKFNESDKVIYEP